MALARAADGGHCLVTGAPGMGKTTVARALLREVGDSAGRVLTARPSAVDADLAGTASAVFNTFRQVGGAVAIAVFGALVADPDSFVAGLRVSFVAAATLLLLTALLSLRIRRPAPA